MKKKLYLEVKNLECKRNFIKIFDPISFKLLAGDLLIITGDNGKGKTTLLHCLAGLLAYQGKINWKIEDKIFGYVGHKLALKENDTVLEFIEFWGKVYKTDLDYNNIIKLFNLKKILYTPIAYLSFGQKKKIAFARLYLLKSKIWLLDEPFSGMDCNNKKLIGSIIKKHNSSKGVAIISTNEPINILNINNKQELHIV